MFTTNEKTEKLRDIYGQIHSCRICAIGEDSTRIARILDNNALKSRIFIIGQALGSSTQRLSGRPYTTEKGTLSHTGKRLDAFLSLVGYTIDSCDSLHRQYVYSSDIVQCYPGKIGNASGDRKPNSTEVQNCFNKHFLSREIEIINPKLIFLMGRPSRDTFFNYMEAKYPKSLSEHIDTIVHSGKAPQFSVGNLILHIIPIHHPSGANPKFLDMLKYYKLLDLIRGILE